MLGAHNLDGSQVSRGAASAWLRGAGNARLPWEGAVWEQRGWKEERCVPALHPTDALRGEKKNKEKIKIHSKKPWPSFC